MELKNECLYEGFLWSVFHDFHNEYLELRVIATYYLDTNGKIRIGFAFTCIFLLIVYVNQFRANVPPLFHLKVSEEFFLRGMKENFNEKWTERSIDSEMVR